MSDRTIKIGIDLGTTNSEIAIFHSNQVKIVQNGFGEKTTPSIFGIDKAQNKVVGKQAYENLSQTKSELEFKNYKSEVKRLMGTEEKVHFERAGKDFGSEEISAEILKRLLADVRACLPQFDTRAAVITVPAHFSTLQAEATKRAGNLAGLDHVILLQEPIAAAMAYGFTQAKNENWLVYDLGGGTFDVALIASKDRTISVLGHSGDNFLGGKDFDWQIVENIFKPALLKKYPLKNFDRGNPKVQGVFTKLKFKAEKAKIALTQVDQVQIDLNDLGLQGEGMSVSVSVVFTRIQLEALIRPLVDKTIELTKETIRESGVQKQSINKIILVGGTSQTPYIKNRLFQDFQIPVDMSLDPLIAVASGACVFAASQRIPDHLVSQENSEPGAKNIQLFYESLTSELEEGVSGLVGDLSHSNEEYFIQITREPSPSPQAMVKLKKGRFFQSVELQANKTNVFRIDLVDSQGHSHAIAPNRFSIIHGLSVTGIPLPHSIGISLAKRNYRTGFALTEQMERFFDRNNLLPLCLKRTYRTVKALRRGDSENALPIKVYEGESDLPDRNHLICDLRVSGEHLSEDLPENTEVELTIRVNESREVSVEAAIPQLGFKINARASLYAEKVDLNDLRNEISSQRERFGRLDKSLSLYEKSHLDVLFNSITASLRYAEIDDDDKRKAHKELKDLKMKLDQMERDKEMPQLRLDFTDLLADLNRLIDEVGDMKDRSTFMTQMQILREEGEKAIQKNDKVLLADVIERLIQVCQRVFFSNPNAWVFQFNSLIKGNYSYRNEEEAHYLITNGEKAIQREDLDVLKGCVTGLIDLLPINEQESIRGNLSGITR